MLTSWLLAASLCAAPTPDDPARDFDFWIGEWSVLNRHMADDGTWRDGDTTRARITPMCDGAAVLEEWAGPFGGASMNGFSLRAHDPRDGRWHLLLSWTTTGETTFGRLAGTFRHGRGEFVAPARGPKRTRYTFSDALPDSVRWDSATTEDGGVTWRTDWIMEFSRTRAADDVTQDRFFAEAWTDASVSRHEEARALDGLVGEWRGEREAADGTRLDARLRAKLVNGDCLVVDVLEVGTDDEAIERLCVRGYVPGEDRWQSWRVSEDDPVLRPFAADGVTAGRASFEHADDSGATVRETISIDGDRLTLVEEADLPDGRTVVVATTRLARVP